MAIARSTRARVLCPAGRRHTLTTHLACLRLTSNTAPGAAAVRSHPQPSAWLPACASRCQKSCSRPVEACARSAISPLLRVALPQTKARPCRPQRASRAAAVRSHPQPSAWPLRLPALKLKLSVLNLSQRLFTPRTPRISGATYSDCQRYPSTTSGVPSNNY